MIQHEISNLWREVPMSTGLGPASWRRCCRSGRRPRAGRRGPWLRTNGVSANGAAAEVMNFDRVGKKGTPWQFWEDKSRLMGVPKNSLSKNTQKKCSDPISADPICPLPRSAEFCEGGSLSTPAMNFVSQMSFRICVYMNKLLSN